MTDQHPSRISRRGVLAASGAALLGVAGGLAFGTAPSTGATAPVPAAPSSPAPAPSPSASASADPFAATHPFFGTHQAGITTPASLLQTWIGLDLRTRDRDSAEAVLRLLTDDMSRLTQGQAPLADPGPELASLPSGLTVTVGLGKGFFRAAGVRPPEQLRDIPAFSVDQLEDRWGQTDLVVQVGSDDPAVVSHTVRLVVTSLSTLATVAWLQDGFRAAAHANPGSESYRTLFGQVDGTANPAPGTADFDEVVWVDEGPDWAVGGTVMVMRRIRLLIDEWDTLDRTAMERSIGRHLDSGAPLGRTKETDPLPLDETDSDGMPVIPMDAHARIAHETDNARKIFRRGYNYDDGLLKSGEPDQGLLFVAFMHDPATSFIPMQRKLAEKDSFNTWSVPVGSGTWFVLPGAREGGFLGEGMFS